MNINYIHGFDINDVEKYEGIQKSLLNGVSLKNNFNIENINYIAGVDISYWQKDSIQFGACSIVVINYKTKKLLKKASSFGKVSQPYIPGYLAFRELPLFISCAKKLSYEPDIFMFDGNGYLHGNHLGIATHASFFINKPTIGVAKSYYKIKGADFIMPGDKVFSHTDITVSGETYGRALRSKKGAKPIFISCGNYIDLDTATKVVINMVSKESRVPIPTRLADIETHQLRKELSNFTE
ncbi:MAG: endonuclease V [Clostridiales bacterium]|jgi:deoxyribonuclease V|nr:endonuclease V [Clostridiales bacterium]